jgi:hypothetical protein
VLPVERGNTEFRRVRVTVDQLGEAHSYQSGRRGLPTSSTYEAPGARPVCKHRWTHHR